MRTLRETPYFTLMLDESTGCARLVRNSVKMADGDVDVCLEGMVDALRAAGCDPANVLLLIDVRDGPSINDRRFEASLNEQMIRFTSQLRRYAVLVRTAAGVLQVMRLERSVKGEIDGHVFRDEAQALAYLGLNP